MTQRNSPERAQMLAVRRIRQLNRVAGFSTSNGHFWPSPTRMIGVPASINRRTGKPHEHYHAKARRLTQENWNAE